MLLLGKGTASGLVHQLFGYIYTQFVSALLSWFIFRKSGPGFKIESRPPLDFCYSPFCASFFLFVPSSCLPRVQDLWSGQIRIFDTHPFRIRDWPLCSY